MSGETLSFKRTVVLVAALNLSYFGIEFITARRIGSVSCSPTASTFSRTLP